MTTKQAPDWYNNPVQFAADIWRYGRDHGDRMNCIDNLFVIAYRPLPGEQHRPLTAREAYALIDLTWIYPEDAIRFLLETGSIKVVNNRTLLAVTAGNSDAKIGNFK